MCVCDCHVEGFAVCTNCGDYHVDARNTPPPANEDPRPDPAAPEEVTTVDGTKDGKGAGDHDTPYQFGRKPTVQWPFPFDLNTFARLLVLRGRVRAGEVNEGDAS